MSTLNDLTGQRFGRLVVIRRGDDHVTPRGKRHPAWECVCDCGAPVEARGDNLRSGSPKSCGCIRRFSPDVLTYKNAHRKIKRERGRASEYRCVDCEGPAQDWSYDHQDPNELRQAHHYSGRLVPYSGDPWHYEPRCKPCHTTFDRGRQ